jgi:hypothetical protein
MLLCFINREVLFYMNFFSSHVWLLIIGMTTIENVFATSEKAFLSVTLDRVQKKSGDYVPVFPSEDVATKICAKLKNFERFDFFQKAQIQKRIYKALWVKEFETGETFEDPNLELKKTLAVDSGLSAMVFYQLAISMKDERAVFPMFKFLNDSKFCKNPDVAEQIRVNRGFQIPFLTQEVAELVSFDEILKHLSKKQSKTFQKQLLNLFQKKTESKEPTASILKLLIDNIRERYLEENSQVNFPEPEDSSVSEENNNKEKNPLELLDEDWEAAERLETESAAQERKEKKKQEIKESKKRGKKEYYDLYRGCMYMF